MNVLNRQQLKGLVLNDFKSSVLTHSDFERAVGEVLLSIVEKLPATDAAGKTYSVSKIKKLINVDGNNEQILAALNYLSTSRIDLFKHSWFLMSEEYSIELDESDFAEVMARNAIAHPETGLMIHDAKKHVFLSFTRVAGFE